MWHMWCGVCQLGGVVCVSLGGVVCVSLGGVVCVSLGGVVCVSWVVISMYTCIQEYVCFLILCNVSCMCLKITHKLHAPVWNSHALAKKGLSPAESWVVLCCELLIFVM